MGDESPPGAGDLWGEGEPPLMAEVPPLQGRLARLAAMTGATELGSSERFLHPRAEDLPEVAALASAGWRVSEPAPMWSFLPAVWPRADRGWVADRLPRFSRTTSKRGNTVVAPWDAEMAESIHESTVELLGRVGLPPPPAGRIWLLRSLWPSIGVSSVVSMISLRSEERGGGGMLDDVLVEAAREVLGWDEEWVWSWWPGERGAAARAWRDAGRTGEDAAPLIAVVMTPELLAAYRDHGFDEEAALGWAALDRGPEGLEHAIRWTALRLSPDEVDYDLNKLGPEEVERWLAEGFDLPAIRLLAGLPLDRAAEWRDAGITPRDVQALLEADPLLTPAEAARFDEAGIGPDERIGWIELGFDADLARGWTGLGLFPNEARVWRAAGHTPATAAEHIAGKPPGPPPLPPGQYAWGVALEDVDVPRDQLDLSNPRVRRAVRWSVADPPGTRGRRAQPRGRRGET